VKSWQEIIAWRKCAAWATDAQVEQDLLLTQAMVAIFRDPFLFGQVAMRGGTALHKLHLAPAARRISISSWLAADQLPTSSVRWYGSWNLCLANQPAAHWHS
jgi:hypothetical protein